MSGSHQVAAHDSRWQCASRLEASTDRRSPTGAINRAATLAAGATPKWLLRRIAGVLGRKVI
jgi:hypothetical protein